MVENCPSLIGFLERVKERCFPDWEEILSSLKMNTHIPEEEKKDAEKEPAKEKEAEKEKGEEIKAEKKEEVKAEEAK
jgi:hypothetical protein